MPCSIAAPVPVSKQEELVIKVGNVTSIQFAAFPNAPQWRYYRFELFKKISNYCTDPNWGLKWCEQILEAKNIDDLQLIEGTQRLESLINVGLSATFVGNFKNKVHVEENKRQREGKPTLGRQLIWMMNDLSNTERTTQLFSIWMIYSALLYETTISRPSRPSGSGAC